MTIMHGFWSDEAEKKYGWVKYHTPQDTDIKVTGVYGSKEQGEENYDWPDKIYVGEVFSDGCFDSYTPTNAFSDRLRELIVAL